MRAKDKTSLIKVGLFVTILTFVMMVMIVAIGKESSLFSPKSVVKAEVRNAENLKPGAVVELKGLRIGTVQDIKIIQQELVEIVLSITSENIKWIKKDSKVSINNAGLVGDKYLEIVGGSDTAPEFNPEKDKLTSEPTFDFKAMASKGGSIADRADRVLAKIEEMLVTVDSKSLGKTLNDLARTSENFSKASEPMISAVQKMEQAMTKIDGISGRIEKGPGTAHSLIYDDAVYDNLRKLFGGAERSSVIKYFIRESIKKAPKKEP